MSTRTMEASVIVKLRDTASRGIDQLRQKFERLRDSVRRIGQLGAALAGLGGAAMFGGALRAASSFDAVLRDIAITAGLTGTAVERSVAEIGAALSRVALETGQTNIAIAGAAQKMIAAGIDQSEVMRLIPLIGRVATAAGADIADIAGLAISLNQNLRIPAAQMEMALARLAVAGKEGRFELRAMAREFPQLTGAMANLGVTGMRAIETLGPALQVAMRGAGSESEAANNLQNFLAKLGGRETREQFRKHGMDLTRLMQNAAAQGLNPVEAVIERVQRFARVDPREMERIYRQARGRGASDQQAQAEVRQQMERIGAAAKIGELFGDMQVLNFLVPMLANVGEYMRIQERTRGADPSVILNDFQSRMRGIQQQTTQLQESLTQLGQRIGLAFATNIPLLTRAFEAMQQGIAWLDERYPSLIDATAGWAGAVLLVVAGLGALGVVWPIVAAGAGVVAAAAGGVGRLLLLAGQAAFWLARAALPALGLALRAVGVVAGAAFSPLGLAVMGLIAIADAAYRKWDEVRAGLAQVWDGIASIFTGAVQAIMGVIDGEFGRAAEGAKQAWDGLKTVFEGLLGILAAVGAGLADAARGLLAWVDGIAGTNIAGKFDELRAGVVDAFRALPGQLMEAGAAAIQGLWDGMRRKADELLAWARDIPARLGGILQGINPFGGAAPAPAIGTMDGFGPPPAPAAPVPGRQSMLAPAPGGRQGVEVGGVIRVEATEGTRVTAQSTNPQVPLATDRGPYINRS